MVVVSTSAIIKLAAIIAHVDQVTHWNQISITAQVSDYMQWNHSYACKGHSSIDDVICLKPIFHYLVIQCCVKEWFELVVSPFMSCAHSSVSQWCSALVGFSLNNAIEAVIWYWYHPLPQLILVLHCLILSMGLLSALAHKSQTSPVTTHASLATISQAPSCVHVSLITRGPVTQLPVLLSSVWSLSG